MSATEFLRCLTGRYNARGSSCPSKKLLAVAHRLVTLLIPTLRRGFNVAHNPAVSLSLRHLKILMSAM